MEHKKIHDLLPRTKRERQQILRKYPGLLASVADELGVSRPTVTLVFKRRTTSRRVATAISDAIARRQAEQGERVA